MPKTLKQLVSALGALKRTAAERTALIVVKGLIYAEVRVGRWQYRRSFHRETRTHRWLGQLRQRAYLWLRRLQQANDQHRSKVLARDYPGRPTNPRVRPPGGPLAAKPVVVIGALGRGEYPIPEAFCRLENSQTIVPCGEESAQARAVQRAHERSTSLYGSWKERLLP